MTSSADPLSTDCSSGRAGRCARRRGQKAPGEQTDVLEENEILYGSAFWTLRHSVTEPSSVADEPLGSPVSVKFMSRNVRFQAENVKVPTGYVRFETDIVQFRRKSVRRFLSWPRYKTLRFAWETAEFFVFMSSALQNLTGS